MKQYIGILLLAFFLIGGLSACTGGDKKAQAPAEDAKAEQSLSKKDEAKAESEAKEADETAAAEDAGDREKTEADTKESAAEDAKSPEGSKAQAGKADKGDKAGETGAPAGRGAEAAEQTEQSSETAEAATVRAVNAAEAKRLIAEEAAVLVDVRSKEEHEAGHIEGSILIPYDEIEGLAPQMLGEKEKPVIVYCRSGRRSAIAAEELIRLGYQKVYDLGSIQNWVD